MTGYSYRWPDGPIPGAQFIRTVWLQYVLNGVLRPKPPAWWISAQAKAGRNASTAYSIWWRNYKPERKFVIWDQAPEQDWREHGYLV